MEVKYRHLLHTSVVFLIILGCLGVVSATGDTGIRISPESENITQGEVQGFEVAIEGASDDIYGYEFNITLSNNTTAEIVGVSPTIKPINGIFDRTIAADGSEVAVGTLYLTFNRVFGSDSPIILTVDVQGESVGETNLSIDLTNTNDSRKMIVDSSNKKYNITTINEASITVKEKSSDLDGITGLYDTNGNNDIEITELGEAAKNYAQGEITIEELGAVAVEYANG